MNVKHNKTFFTLLSAVIAWLLIVGTINIVVDPFAVFGTPVIDNFNKKKAKFSTQLPQAKLRQASTRNPEYLILGNSRADRGIDPNHPSWQGKSVYNMAVPGSSIQAIYQHLAFVVNIRTLESY